MKRSYILIAILIMAVFIFLTWMLLLPPGTDALKVGIIGRTSDSLGATNLEIEVSNTSRRIINFAVWVEVLKDGKWVRDELWEPKLAGQLHWVGGHQSRSIKLRAPAGGLKWRFKIMGMEQPTPLKWKWLAAGKKTGLKSEPCRWYLYLDSDK